MEQKFVDLCSWILRIVDESQHVVGGGVEVDSQDSIGSWGSLGGMRGNFDFGRSTFRSINVFLPKMITVI